MLAAITVVAALSVGTALFLSGLVGPISTSRPLHVTGVATPSTGYAPVLVSLVAAGDGGSPPYRYIWSNGSDTLGTGAVLPYHASTAGGYSFTVTALDDRGASASVQVSFRVVSPFPEALWLIPAAETDLGPTLALRWAASAIVSACLLPGYGALSLPAFSQCSGAGGVASTASAGSGNYLTDPDDPEPTPVLFQSTQSGTWIDIAWWYNDTAGTETAGSSSLSTVIAPL